MTNYILRQDLLALLKKGREHPLTLTVAPAGSGKTTLLEQYRAHLAQYEPNTKVCFLNVSDRHNDNNGHNLFVEMFEAVKNIMPLWDEQFSVSTRMIEKQIQDYLPRRFAKRSINLSALY